MTNNQEFFCNYCKETTLFFLESDLLWHCDECGNVLDSYPMEDEYLEDFDVMDNETIIRCPSCRNLISLDELAYDFLCPVCFEDLSDELEDDEWDEWDEDDEEG